MQYVIGLPADCWQADGLLGVGLILFYAEHRQNEYVVPK